MKYGINALHRYSPKFIAVQGAVLLVFPKKLLPTCYWASAMLPCPDLLNNFVSSAYMYIIDVMISVIATQLRCGGIFKYEFVANLINTWWNI